MRLFTAFLLASFCIFFSCKKNRDNNPPPDTTPTTDSSKINNPILNDPDSTDTSKVIHPPTPPKDSFTTYLIKKGNNYCEKNSYPFGTWSSLRFRAILDSSCIYTNVLPSNQLDINKLYGIADCNTFHQVNSARFGWNWVNGEMHIHAYCYADSVRRYKELGTVAVSKPFECKLTVLPDLYLFELDGKTDTMQRGCSASSAAGYKLFPYFGGDEPAPQDIRVKIQEY